jgi:thiol-disulfide isomerase/thioredoxin
LPDLPPPVLEVFYSPSCAPCRLELPVVAQIAGRPDVQIRIVILDQEERAREELRGVSPALESAAVIPSHRSPNELLREAGDEKGVLPYARSVAADGEVCAGWSGGLTMSRAQGLLAACARLVTSPRPSRS